MRTDFKGRIMIPTVVLSKCFRFTRKSMNSNQTVIQTWLYVIMLLMCQIHTGTSRSLPKPAVRRSSVGTSQIPRAEGVATVRIAEPRDQHDEDKFAKVMAYYVGMYCSEEGNCATRTEAPQSPTIPPELPQTSQAPEEPQTTLVTGTGAPQTTLVPETEAPQTTLVPETEAPQTTQWPEVTQTTQEPEAPQTTEEPEVPQTTEEPEVPQTTEEPDVPQPTEEPEVPQTTEKSDVPQTTEEPEAPQTTEEPEVPQTTKEPEAPQTTEEPEVPPTTVEPEVPQTTEEPEAPQTTEETEVPQTTKEPEAPQTTEELEVPQTTVESEVPQTTEEPEAPQTTEEPEVPQTTEEPEVPQTTEEPDEPKTTEEPDEPQTTLEPEVPQTTEEPEVPQTTEEPEVPQTTEEPEVPQTTEEREVPQTTQEVPALPTGAVFGVDNIDAVSQVTDVSTEKSTIAEEAVSTDPNDGGQPTTNIATTGNGNELTTDDDTTSDGNQSTTDDDTTTDENQSTTNDDITTDGNQSTTNVDTTIDENQSTTNVDTTTDGNQSTTNVDTTIDENQSTSTRSDDGQSTTEGEASNTLPSTDAPASSATTDDQDSSTDELSTLPESTGSTAEATTEEFISVQDKTGTTIAVTFDLATTTEPADEGPQSTIEDHQSTAGEDPVQTTEVIPEPTTAPPEYLLLTEDNIETTALVEAGENTDVSFFVAERETIATGFALITALELESAVAEYETEISDAYEATITVLVIDTSAAVFTGITEEEFVEEGGQEAFQCSTAFYINEYCSEAGQCSFLSEHGFTCEVTTMAPPEEPVMLRKLQQTAEPAITVWPDDIIITDVVEGENEAGEQTLEVVFYVSVESEDGAPVYIPEEDLEDVFVEHGDEIADETGGETVVFFPEPPSNIPIPTEGDEGDGGLAKWAIIVISCGVVLSIFGLIVGIWFFKKRKNDNVPHERLQFKDFDGSNSSSSASSSSHSRRRDTHSHSQEESFMNPYDSLHTTYEQPPRREPRQSHGLYDNSDNAPIYDTADTSMTYGPDGLPYTRRRQDPSSPQRKTSNLYASSNLGYEPSDPNNWRPEPTKFRADDEVTYDDYRSVR